MKEQKFLQELEKKLWTSANKLLPSLDAAVYKHVVLGLVFLKYVSDSFDVRRQELISAFKDPDNEYYPDFAPQYHANSAIARFAIFFRHYNCYNI